VLSAKRALFGTAILVILAAACGDDADDSSATEESSPQAEQPEDGRRQGGELRLSAPIPESLDPHVQVNTIADLPVNRMLYRGLYSLDTDNNVVSEANGIATGPPEFSGDGRTVTVRINDGLRWSDGDDLRAEDFVAGVIRTCNPIVGAGFQALLSNIVGCDDFFFADPETADLEPLQAAVGVRALDELTVQFELNERQVTFPVILSLWVSFPVPVHLERFAAATPSEPGEWGLDPAQLTYNGPYVLERLDEEAVLSPNPNWSGTVVPTLDSIVIRDVVRPEQALELARDGTTDGGADLGPLFRDDPAVLSELPAEFGDQYAKVAIAQTRGLLVQVQRPPLDNLDVRLALARALDREAINNDAVGGANQPTTSWVPESLSGVPLGTYDELIGYDPDAARAHLAAAGYPDGLGFPLLRLMINEEPSSLVLAELIRDGYKAVLNIDVEIEIVPAEVRFERTTAGQFDLTTGGWAADYPDIENWILGLFNTEGSSNFSQCSNPEIDGLISEAQFNPDPDERRGLYIEAERAAIASVCGQIPIFHEAAHYLVSTDVVGMLENVSASDTFIPGDNTPEAWGFRG
jgi:oligopeptide transport system substrate-binding protein